MTTELGILVSFLIVLTILFACLLYRYTRAADELLDLRNKLYRYEVYLKDSAEFLRNLGYGVGYYDGESHFWKKPARENISERKDNVIYLRAREPRDAG